jgi:stage III sporulation protein SpoIIIAA
MPQVIIIDEIGTELEVLAARTIAEKGVQLVGTTHGNCLKTNKNPSLADLIGGIQYVTLSDDEAKRRGTQKSILERKAAFEIIIEINDQNSWTIHEDVRNSVDLFYEVILQLGRLDIF